MIVFWMLACTVAECPPTTMTWTEPEDGAGMVPVDSAFSFGLDRPADQVSLFIDGGVTDGWIALSGGREVYEWTPPAPLQTGQTYTAVVETCRQEAGQVTFSTLPAPSGEAVVGQTFAIDMFDDDLVWVSPPLLPPEKHLADLLAETTSLLLMPDAVGEGSLDMVMALGEADGFGSYLQHDCVSAADIDGVTFTGDPSFFAEPSDITVSDRGEKFVIHDLSFEGTFSEGGATILDFRMTMRLDTRSLTDLNLCALAEVFKTTCTHCDDQDATEDPACTDVELIAPRLEAIDLELIADMAKGKGC